MALQLPSLGTVVAAALRTLRRFPLAVAASVLAAVAAVLMQEDVGPAWLRDPMLAAAALGIPLLTAVQVTVERRAWPLWLRILPVVAALAVLAGVYASWMDWPDRMRFVRLTQLLAASHLAVAFLPFAGRYRANAFWQYNRALLLRLVGAGISSGTLFVGAALALAAVDKLFGVEVPEAGYFRLWVLMAFVFNTWFFLGGVPEDPEALEDVHDYPTPLRVFAQYILVPLVSVYLVILSAYLVKVVATWDWPSGWIGWLVSGVAVAGILTLLLVRPIADDPDQNWVAAFARIFWLAVLPAVAMLWLALYQRVAQYGITEPRYFLLVLSLWLAAIALWYSVTRSRDMRLVPLTLCVGALLTYAGPWSAYAVSARSQVGRLNAILARNGMLEGGRARAPGRPMSDDDAREVSAVVRYLEATHGTARLAALVPDSAKPLTRGTHRHGDFAEGEVRRLVTILGAPYVERGGGGSSQFVNARAARRGAILLTGYDVLVRVREAKDSLVGDSGVVAYLVPDARVVRVRRGATVLVDVPLDSAFARAGRASQRLANQVPPEQLHVEATGPGAHASLWLEQLAGQDSAGTITPSLAIGDVLVDLRP